MGTYEIRLLVGIAAAVVLSVLTVVHAWWLLRRGKMARAVSRRSAREMAECVADAHAHVGDLRERLARIGGTLGQGIGTDPMRKEKEAP